MGDGDSNIEAQEHSDQEEHSEERPSESVGQEQAHSHHDYVALRRKNQEIKLRIKQLQDQISQVQQQHQQEVNTSKRLRQQRDQYRSTAKGLANQVTQLLQQQEEQEDFYNLDEGQTKGQTAYQNEPVSNEKISQNAAVSHHLRKKIT